MKYSPRISGRAALLERLSQGPLPLSDWPQWAASKGSLKSRISILRELGHRIEGRPLPGKPGLRPPVEYVLLDCPTCRREMPS